MYEKTKEQISQLRKLDELFRAWAPPEGYELRITREETSYGVVTVRVVHRDGRSHEFDVLYSETIAKAKAKLESEFQFFKAEVEAGGA